MASLRVGPGPTADQAFRLGIATATVVALAGLATLYATGAVSAHVLAFVVVVGFPVYLLFVASALSVWLGFDKDVTDLRPVYRERNDGRGR